jgi:hypothetical protein
MESRKSQGKRVGGVPVCRSSDRGPSRRNEVIPVYRPSSDCGLAIPVCSASRDCTKNDSGVSKRTGAVRELRFLPVGTRGDPARGDPFVLEQ